MAGVVAAGSIPTAEVSASILRAGGNAVDAALAGALACFAAEPLLASAGGAGIMLVRRPGDLPIAVDFFSTVPGAEGRPEHLDFQAVEVNFGAARQAFHVGRAAAAVPLVFEGIAAAARRFGTLPLPELVAPTVRLAREGVVADELTARTFELLWQILRRDPGCMAEIAEGLPSDRPPRQGERLRNSRLADTLEQFAELGAAPPVFRQGLLANFGPARGGLISAADLAGATVSMTAPYLFTLGEWRVATSPRLGGRLVGMIAEALAAGDPEADEAEELLRQAKASQLGHRGRLLNVPPANHRGATTHVSVVDDQGGAASVTLTAGEGCGHVVPGTGVHINNFLGEEDLNPGGFHTHAPGAALPTMIAPTIAMHPSGRVIALGSGGSNRIRSAVGLVLHALCRGRPIDEAVRAPRVHGEDHAVWVELADRSEDPRLEARLGSGFSLVHPFAERDFFFGGVHVAERSEDGVLRGAADARRNGAARVVD